MNISFRYLVIAGLFALLMIPVSGLAAGSDNYDADARFAENVAPVIPHRIGVDANGEACLACHRAGLNKAPLSPHPVRLNCTQCHVRGDISEPRAAIKKGKNKK